MRRTTYVMSCSILAQVIKERTSWRINYESGSFGGDRDLVSYKVHHRLNDRGYLVAPLDDSYALSHGATAFSP
ncbi:uncharacterized protein BT62DRAFT_1009201 [Guyanagaster necrorhizus]|uniref:Uncharacterized protein n=1 Tax=Guyanagaster necrorhizus TaxID=856835 RepID=A0A9P8APW2_9AGAR|nr:uncharacterized protein BT62DRAFT_1009201 [Guyanagaster necrorhizus MCA 3950]KAG7443390.1 hypothetical protein BT62DRAFT_1009201 [Guyanagaster necrorhizus MCA 3950]